MSERRPETTGRRSARALMILSILLVAGAGALAWLHLSGRLQPLVAAGPSIEVELPARIAAGGPEAMPAPDAAESPSAVAELSPPPEATPAAPETPAEPAEPPLESGAVEPGHAAPVPAAPAPESPAVAPPADGPGQAVPAPGETVPTTPEATADAAAEASAQSAPRGPAGDTPARGPDSGSEADAAPGDSTGAQSTDAEIAAQAADEPPPPAPPVPELPAPEVPDEPEAEATPRQGTAPAPGAADEAAAEAADSAPAPTPAGGAEEAPENPQVAAAIVPPGTVPTWQRLARPFPPEETRPRIAVVVAGLGLSEAATTAAIQQLPAEITLSFSPYSNRIQEWVAMAQAAGHEVLIDLPMEPASFPRDDPGPQALLTSLGEQTNAERLAWTLSRTDGFLGVATFMGSRFTTSPEHMRPVMDELARRGLLILDSRAAADSLTASLAAEQGVAHAINDRFIDNEASRVAIDGRLQQIERIARTKGVAVAMGYAYPVTIERLDAWVRSLPGEGLTLAPISAVANRQEVR